MKTLKKFISLLLVGLFLAACSTVQPEFKTETPLYTDEDLMNATPVYAETTDVDVATLDLSGGLSAMPSEVVAGGLEPQVIDGCQNGIVTYVRQPAGVGNPPYEIRQKNMSTGADILIYVSAFPIQSAASDNSGNYIVFTIDDALLTGFNLYLLDRTVGGGGLQRLTNWVGDELNASITRLANNATIAWDATNGGALRKIYYRNYTGLPGLPANGAVINYQRKIQGVLPWNDSQPSVDNDGEFIGFIRNDGSSRVMRHQSTILATVILVTSPLANPLSHPSPNFDGSRMAYMRTAANEQVRVWPANLIESTAPLNRMNHAHMRSAGDCLVVSKENNAGEWRVYATLVDGVNGAHSLITPGFLFDSVSAFWQVP